MIRVGTDWLAAFADAARWGAQPTPPAPPAPDVGEVGAVVADLRYEAANYSNRGFSTDARRCRRAATLLQQQQHLLTLAGAELDRLMAQQQAAPAPPVVPVAVSERLPGEGEVIVRFEFEVLDEHNQTVASGDAPTLEEAAREGHHYLQQYQQDGPCTLELRRVEVLSPSHAIPLPQAGEGEGNHD